MNEAKNVIELNHVTKDYGDFKLDDVSFCVPEGIVCGFVGQNGVGKTTTINLILDAIRRDRGEIRVFGEEVDKADKLECLLRSPRCPFVLYVGKRNLVKRKKFEKFISDNIDI